jgi:hypothetical protein
MRRALVASILMATTAVLFASSPRDALACDPGRTKGQVENDLDSRYRPGVPVGEPEEIRSTVVEKSPYVEPLGLADGTVNWIMIDNNTTPQRWAQLGWEKKPDNYPSTVLRRWFIEWVDYQGVDHYEWAQDLASPESWTTFDLFQLGVDQDFYYYVMGSPYWTSPDTFHNRRETVGGETLSRDSQMPGTTTSHEKFTSTVVLNQYDNTYSFNGDNADKSFPQITNGSIHGQDIGNYTQRIDIWDKGC